MSSNIMNQPGKAKGACKTTTQLATTCIYVGIFIVLFLASQYNISMPCSGISACVSFTFVHIGSLATRKLSPQALAVVSCDNILERKKG